MGISVTLNLTLTLTPTATPTLTLTLTPNQALHSVLLQLLRPDMNAKEACAATGASSSNFAKWRKRVHELG